MSEPQSSGALAVEMAGLDVIPESDRKGKPSDLFMPWFAANISVLGISWGSWVLGFGLSLTQAIVVSVDVYKRQRLTRSRARQASVRRMSCVSSGRRKHFSRRLLRMLLSSCVDVLLRRP